MTRSFTVQSFVDARLVADLVRMFNEEGVEHKASYSHLVNTVLKAAHQDWKCDFFQTTEDALQYLQLNGFSISQLGTDGRGQKTLRVLNKETLQAENREHTEEESAVEPARANELAGMFGEGADESDKD